MTVEDFNKLLCHFDECDIGGYIAAWAEASAYHPKSWEGVAMITLTNGAAVARWFDSGFWEVILTDEADAHAEIEAYAAQFAEESKDSEA